MQHNMLISV